MPSEFENSAGPLRTGPGLRALWWVGLAASLVVVAGTAAFQFRSNGDSSAGGSALPPPAPRAVPDAARGQPYFRLLDVVLQDNPPQPDSERERPRMGMELFVRRGGRGELQPLSDGGRLQSRADDYLILATPATAGNLYVFQIDSAGSVAWLFPRNESTIHSSGANPVEPNGAFRIPGNDRVLFLDDQTGIEQIVAVFAAARWPELERRLEAASSQAPSGAVPVTAAFSLTRGVGGVRPAGTRLPAELRIATPEADELVRLVRPSSAIEYEADGAALVVSRWFHHD